MAQRAGRGACCKHCGGAIYFLAFETTVRRPLEAHPVYVIPDPAGGVGGYATDGDWIQGREVPNVQRSAVAVRQMHTYTKCKEAKRRRRFQAATGRGNHGQG